MPYSVSEYGIKELILEQKTGENNPMYQFIFDSTLHHRSQYIPISTLTLYQRPRPQYQTHYSTY